MVGATRAGWRLLAAVACLAILAGCAGPQKIRGELRYLGGVPADGKMILFPPYPDLPRLAYGGELIGEANLQVEPETSTRWKAFLRFLTGVGQEDRKVELTRPQAVTTDAAGRIFVSDVGLAAVFVFDPAEGEVRVLTDAAEGLKFVAPTAMAVGPDGTIFVSDAEAGLVARIGPNGETFKPIGRGVLKRPAGVIFDKSQNRLIVADSAENTLKAFDLEGRLLMNIGKHGAGPGEFNRPTYLAIWKNELYVSDTFNARVQVLDLDSFAYLRSIGNRGIYVGQLTLPKGIALDLDGNLYVVESRNDHLLIFSRDGRFLLPIGGSGYGPDKFYLPSGLWADANNRIYMADMFNGRVVTFIYLSSEAESDD
jgi:sugar lactone lactonase YvrE